jgi:hypothetical protein
MRAFGVWFRSWHMNPKGLFVAAPAALVILGNGAANAGDTTNDVGAVARVNDKWDEREPDKGHKLVDYAGRCLNIPDDPPKATEMSALALSRVITMSAIGT